VSEPFAWLLNLDAEIELAFEGPYTRRRSVERLVQENRVRCVDLCRGEPVMGSDTVLDGSHRVYCWSPTPSALARLAHEKLRGVAGPPVEVLRAVNHRAWPLHFAPRFSGRAYFERGTSPSEVLSAMASRCWVAKRPFGFAGRGQRRLPATPSADDVRWVSNSLGMGGLLIEPAVEIETEYSIHGYVDSKGVVLGSPCRFSMDATGSPTQLELAEGDPPRDRALVASARLVAEHLARAGYFGPFGVDAFEYRNAGTHLNAQSEVNARFTLGWSTGMGGDREAVLERYARGR